MQSDVDLQLQIITFLGQSRKVVSSLTHKATVTFWHKYFQTLNGKINLIERSQNLSDFLNVFAFGFNSVISSAITTLRPLLLVCGLLEGVGGGLRFSARLAAATASRGV